MNRTHSPIAHIAVTRASSLGHAVGHDGYLLCRPITGQRGLGPGAFRAVPGDVSAVDCRNCRRVIERSGR